MGLVGIIGAGVAYLLLLATVLVLAVSIRILRDNRRIKEKLERNNDYDQED